MSYFSDFLRTIPIHIRQELAHELSLSATVRKVLEAHIHAVEHNHRVSALPSKLGMSITHFDKCVSIALTRCYDYAEKKLGESIFHILAKAGLHESYLHELAKRDRVLRRGGPKGELEKLYHTAVEAYLLFEARVFQEKVWSRIGTRYCELAQSKEAPTIVRIRSLIREMFVQRIRGSRDEGLLKYERELVDLWNECKERDWPESHILLCRALAQYYSTTSDTVKVIEWWERTLLALQKNPTLYPDAQYIVRASLAEAYLHMNGRKKALAQCDAIWNENPSMFARNGHLNLIYFRLLLICNKKRKAAQILKLRYGSMDVLQRHQIRPMDATDFSLYYLHSGDYAQAKSFISAGLAMSVKLFHGIEAELRFLECAAFALNGEYFHALEFLQRSLRYFATKESIPDAEHWKQEFRHLRALIQHRDTARVIPARTVQYYESLQCNSLDVFSNVQMLCWKGLMGR